MTRADAHLVLHLSGLQAFRVVLDDEPADAEVAEALVHRREDDVDVRDPAVGDESFDAVQDPVFPVLRRGGRDICDVGSGVGFREAQGTEAGLGPGESREEPLLLLFRPHVDDRQVGQARADEARRHPRAAPVQFLGHDDVGQGRVDPAAPVRLRDERGVQSEGVGLLDHVPGDRPLAVVLEGHGTHLPLREFVGGLLHQPLFVRQVEIDHRPALPPLSVRA